MNFFLSLTASAGFIPDLKKGRALKAKKGTTFKKQSTPPSHKSIWFSKRGHYDFKTFF